ncbi:hypothetical protein QBC32DRAFT_225709, partial [Pseudoneurospora amorphoporcata]
MGTRAAPIIIPDSVPDEELLGDDDTVTDEPRQPGSPDGGGDDDPSDSPHGGGGWRGRPSHPPGGGDPDEPRKNRSHDCDDDERCEKVKREDVGTFDPDADDPKDQGVVNDGKYTIYTDVYAFREQMLSFIENAQQRQPSSKMNKQLTRLFHTCLAGSARVWWTVEVDNDTRLDWKEGGIYELLDQLVNRFLPDAATATAKFTRGRICLREIYDNAGALTFYVQRQMRYAKAMGTLTKDNRNWYGVMMQIWSSMELRIQQNVRAPFEEESLADYMQLIRRSRAILTSAAR